MKSEKKTKDSSDGKKAEGSKGVTKYGGAKRKFTAEPLSMNSWVCACVCSCFPRRVVVPLNLEYFVWVDTLAVALALPLIKRSGCIQGASSAIPS